MYMSSGSTPDLTGQVAIVTGAGRGLGHAIAIALAAAGATVAVLDRATGDTATAIEAAGGQAVPKTVDVTDQSAVEQAIHEVEQQIGAVDLLMNNAGIGAESLGRVWELDPDWWWRTINVNLRGPFLCARAVLPGMIHRRRGVIINMSSGVAWGDIAGVTAYCASKAGVARFTSCLALETKEFGIATFAINPGLVMTPLNRQ
jgi:NAD(P)-dependent dehydrogenase (short-subunit alcohol dehydrogenase family)